MSWTDILGHDTAKRLLSAHLASGTTAGAYLFAGPDGVGKRRLALELAKALNCVGEAGRGLPQAAVLPSPPRAPRGAPDVVTGRVEGCDQCLTCRQIDRGVHPDVHVLQGGGASQQIGVEEVRHLLGRIELRPFSARVQVAILDGAERMTEEAANAMLKTLEEPSSRTKFLLITAELLRCLPTVVSRCQLIRCQPLPAETVQQILVGAHDCVPAVATVASKLSQGSASRAIALARRWEVYAKGAERFCDESVESWMAHPLPETRQEVMAWLELMMAWLRDLAVCAVTVSRSEADESPSGWIAHTPFEESLRRQAVAIDVDRCVETVFDLMALRDSLEQFVSPRLVASLAREKWLALTTV